MHGTDEVLLGMLVKRKTGREFVLAFDVVVAGTAGTPHEAFRGDLDVDELEAVFTSPFDGALLAHELGVKLLGGTESLRVQALGVEHLGTTEDAEDQVALSLPALVARIPRIVARTHRLILFY